MECKYCGKEFKSKGLLLAHYREHKKEEINKIRDEIACDSVEQDKSYIPEKSIPADWCPNAEYLGNNKTICMRVLGIKKGDKIFITQIDII